MRVDGSYPTPTSGISTLAPRNRLNGQASSQVNFRSDPVNKLTKRPPLRWVKNLLTVDTSNLISHVYVKNGEERRFVLNKDTGTLYSFIDGEQKNSINLTAGYIGINDKIVIKTINESTFILNVNKVVEMETLNDINDVEKVSHVNITAALNYGESIKLIVTLHSGTVNIVEFSVPALGDPPDYDTADAARATAAVASSLAALLNAKSGISASAKGSSLSVWEEGRANWLTVEVETGQGDRSATAINESVKIAEALPLYAVHGTRIKVQPNPTTNAGVYYLQAERLADTPSVDVMEDVVWAESRSPTDNYSLDWTTLPQILTYSETGHAGGPGFVYNSDVYKDRTRGDASSVREPAFVNDTIKDIGYIQSRLVFLTSDKVIMSETNDVVNFWKQSAITDLATDPVEISSNAVGINDLSYIIPHNKDLLVVASNGQFKIDGTTAIQPSTISMTLTTRYECQTDVEPVSMGNSVYFPIDYGSSVGIQQYSAQENTSQDFATPITHHIIGYMKGRIKFLKTSPNLEMLVAMTTEAENNQLFVYEQYSGGQGDVKQRSWSMWEFSIEGEVVDITLTNDKLSLLVVNGTKLISNELTMYGRVATGSNEIFLDNLLKLSTTGTTLELPVDYDTTDIIMVRGEGTNNEFSKVGFTIDGTTVTFEEDIGTGFVYLGKLYTASYSPTRPFIRDENGTTVNTDRLRIAKYILNVVETNEVNMSVQSDYYDVVDQYFNSRFVGKFNNKIGEVPFHTGDVQFSYSQNADHADVTFYSDNYLSCTIVGISWSGQHFKAAGRM